MPAHLQNSSDLLALAVVLSVAVTIIRLLTSTVQWLASERIGNQMVLHLRSKLFERAQLLSVAYHESKGAADALYRIQHDATGIQALVIWKLVPFGSAVVMFVTMVVVIEPGGRSMNMAGSMIISRCRL